MIKFDLFKLHNPNEDLKPKSWVCFKGKTLERIIDMLVRKSIKQLNCNRTKLVDIIHKKMGYNKTSITDILNKKKEWVPIPFLLILIRLAKNVEIKKNIIEGVELLKVNSATSKSIKAVKELTEDLCKICGAHAADGNISSAIGIEIKDENVINQVLKIVKKYDKSKRLFKTQNKVRIKIKNTFPTILNELLPLIKAKKVTIWLTYGINITENYKKAVEACEGWIKQVFGIEVRVKHHHKKNAWRLDFDNKIISRYLIEFFNFPAGPKSYIVKEPDIIKNSEFKFRKAFLMGLLTFEGYVPLNAKNIGILAKSKKLVEDAKEIMNKIGIPTNNIRQDTVGRWVCNSIVLNEDELKIALNLFERGTKKWQRIYERINGFSYKCNSISESIQLLEDAYPKASISKASIVDILKIIYEEKIITHEKLRIIFGISKGTLGKYLGILKRCNIIYTNNKLSTVYLNDDPEAWLLPDIRGN